MVLILLTCLALLRPDAAVMAACHQAATTADACCAAACSCCSDAGDGGTCCCSEEESPAAPSDRSPPPSGAPNDLERALSAAGPAIPWILNEWNARVPMAPARVSAEPHASGRAVLRQACRLRH
jgi:hypothetical protein